MPEYVFVAEDGTFHPITASDKATARKTFAEHERAKSTEKAGGHSNRPKGREQIEEEGESWSPYETSSNHPEPTSGRLGDLLQPKAFGELKAYEPSFRENLVASIGTAGQALGLDKYRAWETGRRVTDLLDWTTPVGMVISLDEAKRAYQAGDVLGTTLGVAGGIPIVGLPIKGAKVGRKVLAGSEVTNNPADAAQDALADTTRSLPAQPSQGTASVPPHGEVAGPRHDGSDMGAGPHAIPAPGRPAETLPENVPIPDGQTPAQLQQSFPAVSPNSKLARILREGVQLPVPHSPIPRDHPARGVLLPVADLVENKPGAIVGQQGNAFIHPVPDKPAIDAHLGSPIMARAASVVEDTATNAAQQALLETMTPRTGNGMPLVPAQPRQGFASASPHDELAGLFREGVQPNVPQTPIPRYDPPRGVSPRIGDLVANRDVRDKVIENIERGTRMGGTDWLNVEPLRLAFIDELGALEGSQRFDHLFDLVGASTALSKVRENFRNATFYYTLNGRLPDKNPYPYGHRAQAMHRRNVERVWNGGLNPITHPKSVTMSANAKGNYLPVMIDSNIFRQAAMLSGDRRFLNTFLPTKSGVSRNIRREYDTGLIRPEELTRPSYWSPAPQRNEYLAMEQYFQGIARELGMTPAQAESAAWLGGAELTRLHSDPSKKLMDFVKDSLLLTAIEKNMDPRDVFRRMVRAELPLLALGGVALAPQLGTREDEGVSELPIAKSK